MTIRRFTITLTAEGPVHVGDGTTIGKKEYFTRKKGSNSTVAVLDASAFVSKLSEDQLASYCDFLQESSRRGLQEYLDENPKLTTLAEACVLYETDTELSRRRGGGYQFFDVARFVKDAYGCPYIPGSSLKGALRTALLCLLVSSDPKTYENLYNQDKRGKSLEKNALWVEAPDPINPSEKIDIMRYVSVSDSDALQANDLVLAKKYDLFSKRDDASHKHDMGNLSDTAYYQGNELNIYRECLKPGTKVLFSVDIDSRIDSFLPEGYTLDKKGLENVLAASHELYSRCFLDKFDFTQDGPRNEDGRCSYVYQGGPLEGSRCRNSAVGDTCFCNIHAEHAGSGTEPATDKELFCYIGGGTDYAIKTIANAIFSDDATRIREIAHILYEQFPSAIDPERYPGLVEDVQEAGFNPKPFKTQYDQRGRVKKAKVDHRHWRSAELGVAPHTLKLGKVGDKKYPFGKCKVGVELR